MISRLTVFLPYAVFLLFLPLSSGRRISLALGSVSKAISEVSQQDGSLSDINGAHAELVMYSRSVCSTLTILLTEFMILFKEEGMSCRQSAWDTIAPYGMVSVVECMLWGMFCIFSVIYVYVRALVLHLLLCVCVCVCVHCHPCASDVFLSALSWREAQMPATSPDPDKRKAWIIRGQESVHSLSKQ